MIGVIVGRGDHLDAGERLRRHGDLCHSHVWFVSVGVLPRQRVRQVGIEQQAVALPRK
ncbi:uncharacterized protein METZ01_LOCUS452322 [marine metagenome]|uniref:Uncharacterized protein n=1 Tax=marine metagenome TaxID=408172 RepID=A0A382ZXS8_9ZZZZ